MGVYVNEDMPKDCYTCFCYETEFNMCSLTGKRLDNNRVRQDDCPLIEIPDEIWEALKPKVDTMSMALKGWVEDVLKSKNGFGVDN